MSLLIVGAMVMFLGIGLWVVALANGIIHNMMYMMLGIVMLNIGGALIGIGRYTTNKTGVRTRQ
jgi:hypothetical protein